MRGPLGRLLLPVVVASLGVAAAAAYLHGRAAPPGAAAHEPVVADQAGAAPAHHGEGAEILRLRADLQAKDRLIRELTVHAIAKDAEKAAAAPVPKENEPALHACEVLDNRLASAPSNPGAKAELENALRGALDPQVLGASKLESLQCAGTLCKVAMTAESDGAIEASVGALAERLPKVFAATVVYATDDGERSVYLARSNDALALDVPEGRP